MKTYECCKHCGTEFTPCDMEDRHIRPCPEGCNADEED